MIDQAVILCAGLGTRLGELTKSQAKPMLEVAEKPFVSYLIDDLIEVGVKDIVLLVGYLEHKFEPLKEKYPEIRLVQSDKIVNTGVLGIKKLKYKFLVANGDCYPIFKESYGLQDLLSGIERPTICVKEKNGSIGDCGLATVDKDSVEMGLVNCGNFASMIGLLQNYFIQDNLHIGDPDGLKGAETWLSGNTSTVSSQSPMLMTS